MDTPNEVKVTIKDTVVMEQKNDAPGDVVVTDSKGRKLKIKGPDVLSESRLVRMMGESASNVAYMYSYVIPSVQVVEIDGDPVGFPMSMRELEVLITRLGREGITAVVKYQVAEAEKVTGPGDELKN